MYKKHLNEKQRTYSLTGLITAIFVCMVFFLQSTQTCGQTTDKVSVPDVNFESNNVYIGILVNNIYSYQYTAGTYTLDLFLYFFWTDPNISTVDWYLINGYPVNPATTVLVSSNLTGEVKYEIYRITAACSTTPDAKDFPFDSIKLTIAIELLTRGYNMELVWLENETGLDIGFINAGWVTTDLDLTTSIHNYPLNAALPRAEMTITQERQLIMSNIQGLIPPTIFAIVSAFSFLFALRDASSVGLRLGLNTSMLVTTLLFNFTVGSAIPPSSSITLYSLFIVSILLFIVLNLIVTVTGFVQWFYYKNEAQTKTTNRLGFILSILIPCVFFILLFFLRG
jgi:hypothetical protein